MAAKGVARHREFIERLLIIALFGLCLVVLWSLRSLLVLIVGALVISVLIRAFADPLMRIPRIGTKTSALLVVCTLTAVFAFLGWVFGRIVADQFVELGQKIPAAWEGFQHYVASFSIGEQALASMRQTMIEEPGLVQRIEQAVVLAGSALSTLLLILFGAIFFAVQPGLYRSGFLKLIPPRRRELADETLGDVGRALRLWMLGQLISMVIVGILTGLGLWWAGVSSPLALGIIAGLTEGIPYLGPILAAIPGLLIALSDSPETALWALLVYVLVQQGEGNTIVPVIQRHTVFLPPALTLFALMAGGLLFGVIGLIFAAPLLVIVYVLVKRLYVREGLGTPTEIPGATE